MYACVGTIYIYLYMVWSVERGEEVVVLMVRVSFSGNFCVAFFGDFFTPMEVVTLQTTKTKTCTYYRSSIIYLVYTSKYRTEYVCRLYSTLAVVVANIYRSKYVYKYIYMKYTIAHTRNTLNMC